MTKHDYKQNAYYLIYYIRCVLHNRIPAKEKPVKMDLSGIFAVAKAHSLAAMAAYALESVGIFESTFEEEKNKAIRKNIILDVERERVISEFEEAKIWYMPLKGIILKDYYPETCMRQMADNDILVDKARQEDIKRIMLECGFYVKQYDKSKHDVYFKEPLCNFQMHVSLFETDSKDPLYCYFKDIDKRLLSEDGSCQRRFTDEDFYLYIKAHEYKHYASGGTGLRNLVDTYLLLNRFGSSYDWDYLYAELDKMQIREYERQTRELSMHLFSGKKLTDEEKKLLDYFIFSGTYGNMENNINNSLKKNNYSKTKYIFSRLIPPMSEIGKRYPIVYRHRILLPFLPVYRVINLLMRNRRKLINEVRILIRI